MVVEQLDELCEVRQRAGQPRWKQTEGTVTFLYRFASEDTPPINMRLKVEINSREHFAVYGFKRMPFSVSSRWFKGQCEISTYEPALQVGMPCEIRVNKAKLTRRSKAALAMTVLSYWLCGDILVGAQGLEPWTR